MKSESTLESLLFNQAQDQHYAHDDARFNHTLHIFDADWFGIRSASGTLPGHKLAISHKDNWSSTGQTHVLGLIFKHHINRVIFQGYSTHADALAHFLKSQLGEDIKLFAISHVNSSQLEYFFEMDMLALQYNALQSGVFTSLGSVKPDFEQILPGCYPKTIINMAPRKPYGDSAIETMDATPGSVFLPLETSWRKNLWTNTLAALQHKRVTDIYSVNWPRGLETLYDLSRIRQTGFLDKLALFRTISASELVLSVTMAECQPMTQLEALAVGRPALVAPLGLTDFADDWTTLSEVGPIDSPAPIIKAMTKLYDIMDNDPNALSQMMAAHLEARHAMAPDRLAEFIHV